MPHRNSAWGARFTLRRVGQRAGRASSNPDLGALDVIAPGPAPPRIPVFIIPVPGGRNRPLGFLLSTSWPATPRRSSSIPGDGQDHAEVMQPWTIILDQADIPVRPSSCKRALTAWTMRLRGARLCVRTFCTFIKAVLARIVINVGIIEFLRQKPPASAGGCSRTPSVSKNIRPTCSLDGRYR